ncbi:MAG: hypothetical protein COS89_06885 [Deltaproteobacteria bacterium CG07_land_8_20_14_0_80_38_7]|nr:MAG: hypothetical protein COS89_06885 [Deltaproteobacteria bacterium CG07_land_8_20_14_0_80_38_7]
MNMCQECKYSGYLSDGKILRCGREAGNPVCKNITKCSLLATKKIETKVPSANIVSAKEIISKRGK